MNELKLGPGFWIYQVLQIVAMLVLVALVLFYPRKDKTDE